MEALAAVSLAGNILQFLNFTCDAISESRQIHASVSGTLKEHDDLEGLTTDLKGLNRRLQASVGPVDPVLELLCSSCNKVADELLKALECLGVKGKYTRSQSLRKALKTLWGKERLKILEERLAGFRQELILHIIVELRCQVDASKVQQTSAFHALDEATKEGAQKILDALQDNRDHLIATTDAQTRHLRALHRQTETILSQEFESAAAKLAEQSETTRALTAEEQQRTRTDVLNAVADAASGYDDAISTEAKSISARIEEANENTRAQITEILDRNQEIMKQEINGLQRGLRQLQLENDRKAEELKEIVIKINTTREGPDRKLLREMGNSAIVVLISLHELYKALEEMLKPLVHQARIAFGTLTGLHIDQSAIEDQTMVELETNLSPEVGISLPMYYAFYYQPLFRRSGPPNLDSEVFSSRKMNEWIQKMRLTSDDPRESSPEARAFFDLARNGNTLVWTMTNLVAGLNACLTPEDALLVLSTALSVRYDPRCVLPPHGSWSCLPFSVRCNSDDLLSPVCTKHPQSNIPSQVHRFFEKGSQQTKLQRARYGLDCTIGKRLAEDLILMSHLAENCGLQGEMNEYHASSSSMGSHFGLSTQRDKADLTLALVALISQTLPWTVKVISRWDAKWRSPHSIYRVLFIPCLGRSIMEVDTSATIVTEFLNAIQSTGIPISVVQHDCSHYYSQFYPHMKEIPTSDRQAWYESVEYHHLLKTESWCPSVGAYKEWKRFRTVGQEQRRTDTLEQRQASTAILADPYVRQLKREYGPSLTPSAAFAGPPSEYDDIDIIQLQKACHERNEAKARADAGQAGRFDKRAPDPEDRSVSDGAADGGLSHPEPPSTPWRVTVSHILEMYHSSAPATTWLSHRVPPPHHRRRRRVDALRYVTPRVTMPARFGKISPDDTRKMSREASEEECIGLLPIARQRYS